MQYQAGYILEAVRESLISFSNKHSKEVELSGLLRSLSTYNVETTLSLEPDTNAPSIIAVASNILTRGLPTLASIYIEEQFADQLKLTRRQDNLERG